MLAKLRTLTLKQKPLPATPSAASPHLFYDALSEFPIVTNPEHSKVLPLIPSAFRQTSEAKAQQMESDERAVRDLLEAERLEHRERELRRREDEEFVRRMQRREREEEETRVRQDEDAVRRMEEEELRGAIGVLECEVCYGENWRAELMVQCPEGHLICVECAKTGALVAFEQLNASLPCLAASDCVAAYPPEETRKFLDEQQLRQLAKLRMEADIASVEGLAACPHCPYAVIMNDPTATTLECLNPSCHKITCLSCKNSSHPSQSCAQAYPTPLHVLQEAMSSSLIRTCPGKCKKPFVKSDGCNSITCTNPGCGQRSCYLCRAKITGYGHFDEPGPCKGLLFDKDVVSAAVEAVRIDGLANLATAEERRFAELFK